MTGAILYHCSPVPGIKTLEPRQTEFFGKPKQVCLTSLPAMAILYGVKHFEYTYGYRDEKLYYQEYFPGALREIYRGKTAYLYICRLEDDMSRTSIPNEYASYRPVEVEREETVTDVYEALLEQERLGALSITRFEDLSLKTREWIVRVEKETILENGLLGADSPFARYMREKYPQSWVLAQKETIL